MPLTPLHVHSHWSLLAGVASVEELVAAAAERGLSALALTDRNALYGAIEFVARCRAAGLRPILGVELELDGVGPPGSAIVLLARDTAGYANLCRLVTRRHVPPRSGRAGLGLDELAGHAAGLIALTGGSGGVLAGDSPQDVRLAGALAEIFGRDDCFVELQLVEEGDQARAAALAALAARAGLATVATHDVRYLDPDDALLYAVLSAMRTGQRLASLSRWPDRSLPAEDTLRRRFAAFPDALANIERVAGLCRLELPLGVPQFPALDLPPGRTPVDELSEQSWAGAAARYGALTPEIEARVRKELAVIDALGYAPYFLVVADIARYAREQGVPVSPRGSASSSVVAYCLGIHDVDPLAHDLYFERFLSLERRDPPDIDMDLCSRRRDEVIDYVYRRYGAEHVAMVCTYSTLRPRLALREVGKAYGLADARIRALSEHLPWYWHPAGRAGTDVALQELLAAAQDETEREVLELARALDGTPHHLSIHPGGIVISPGPLSDQVPLQRAPKGLLITQYDLDSIARLGLVKIDLLGISALTVVADCVELIRRREPEFALETIPAQDSATARMLATARTIGCFQIESPGMRLTLRELSAASAHDLILALALFRPGPLKGGLKDAFVRRHLGQEPAAYLHPALEPILRESAGVILYQEQVLRIAHEVGGFSLGEADRLRRAMSKFRSASEMAGLRAEFVAGAQATAGLDAATAEQVWELMAAFAGYGFPKAHAAGYAALAYRMAYLKAHYPAEFMAARLAVHGGFYAPAGYVGEARRLGLDVRPPHVNHSETEFTLEPPRTLWMGLGQVRELTRATIRAIRARRPFASFDDFLTRVQPLTIEALNLVKAGAFAGLGDAAALLARLEREPWHGRHTAQLAMLAIDAPAAPPVPLGLAERAAFEREVLGMLVSVHPLELAGEALAGQARVRSDALADRAGQVVTLAGVGLSAHRFSARGQERLLLVDMEDEAGAFQVLWHAAEARSYRSQLARRAPMLVRARVSHDRQGQVVLVGQGIQPL
jgi:DNA-directed DNA polymerase III PolC